MLTFTRIRFRNFLATGNTWNTVTLASHATTLICGANGAGKSTILDALCFALYGKPMRNITKPTIINSVNQKECVVELEFTTADSAYRVVRGIKPNVFDIYKDGVLLPEMPSMAEQQEYLEHYILKCNFKAFTQVVILGASTYVPFMRLTPAMRREILEDLLDIEVFATMQSLLKDRFSAHKDVMAEVVKDIAVVESKRALAAKYNEQWEQQQVERRAALEQDRATREASLQTLTDYITSYTSFVAQCDDALQAYDEVAAKYAKALKAQGKLEVERRRIEEETQFFNTTDQCTRCYQPITSETRAQQGRELTERSNQVEADYVRVCKTCDRLKSKLDALDQTREQKRGFEAQVRQWTIQQGALRDEVARLTQEVERTHDAPPPPPDDLGDLAALQAKHEEALYQRYVMEQAALLLKDKGIRTRVIQQYLPLINTYVNEYLTALNFSVQFTLDDQFSETIKSRHRDQFSYESFSDGEKRRIDLALLLTWRAIAKKKNSVNTNLLVFDEILDSSLDVSGSEDFIQIIQRMDTDTNVFVISHKVDQMLDRFARVLMVKKTRGFSTIKALS